MSANEDIGHVDFVLTEFQAVLDADVDGLLDAPEKPQKITSSRRLERAFLEIVEFYRTHGRVPSSSTRAIAERKLGARLDGFLASDERVSAVKHLDEFGLLDAPEAPTSIDELLEGGDLDELLGDDSGILDVSISLGRGVRIPMRLRSGRRRQDSKSLSRCSCCNMSSCVPECLS